MIRRTSAVAPIRNPFLQKAVRDFSFIVVLIGYHYHYFGCATEAFQSGSLGSQVQRGQVSEACCFCCNGLRKIQAGLRIMWRAGGPLRWTPLVEVSIPFE